ncbi:MAG: ferrochelatase, partial [Candidatus Riflebacteria bacterium]|nr:ferrochelatase [Candidatus Riflebacteria bacterium]
RPLLARLISWLRSPRVALQYRAIGGRSPIDGNTRVQVESLQRRLGDRFVVRHAFRHSAPFAAPVLDELTARQVRGVVALPLYPQWSRGTTGSSLEELRRLAADRAVTLAEVRSYPDAEGFVESLAAQAAPMIDDRCHVIMSAHGLPRRAALPPETYVDEVRRTHSAVAACLPAGTAHSLAFQSRLGPVEWVRPYLTDEIARLGAAGVRSMVVLPLSFACENLETLYELDIQAARLARASGVESFRRAPTPGCHDSFIGELARLTRQAAATAGWEATVGR